MRDSNNNRVMNKQTLYALVEEVIGSDYCFVYVQDIASEPIC